MKRGPKPADEGFVRSQVRIPSSLNERLEQYLESPAARRGDSKNSLLVRGLRMVLDLLEKGPQEE